MLKVMAALVAMTISAAAQTPSFYFGTIVSVTDGDTVRVRIPAWRRTPFTVIGVRVRGIDTPESLVQFAKCAGEIELGKAATAYARSFARPGDRVRLYVSSVDKFFRVDAGVKLRDGRDWSALMIDGGYAVPYSGGRKHNWC